MRDGPLNSVKSLLDGGAEAGFEALTGEMLDVSMFSLSVGPITVRDEVSTSLSPSCIFSALSFFLSLSFLYTGTESCCTWSG